MALEIEWIKRADRSFDRIIEYIEGKWGEIVVKTIVRNTYDFLDILSEFPEIGSLQVPEKRIRGFILFKQITVYYKIKGEKIIILEFFDTRQDPKKKRYL